MIDPALLRPVAEVLKLFGGNGTLIVKFRSCEMAHFNKTEPVFVLMDGIPVPFFVATCQPKGNNRAQILFDSIYYSGQALELVGKTLYQPGQPNHPNNVEDPNLLIGFTVSPLHQASTGIVEAFINWPKNPCLSIRTSDSTRSFLVPFQQALIQNIDFKTKHISLILPEGLVEVNE